MTSLNPRVASKLPACFVSASFLLLALPMTAAPVTFWFTGQVDALLNASNTAPQGVAIGTPFDGRIRYNPDEVLFADTNQVGSGTRSQYNFGTTAAFSFTLNIAGNTISNIPNPTISGLIGVEDNLAESDRLYIETSSALMMNGTNLVNFPNQVSMSIFMQDESATAVSAAVLPLAPPVLERFSDGAYLNLVARNSNGTLDLFNIGGRIQLISTSETVQLHVRRASASTVQLAWPVHTSGYTLHSTTNLTTPNWQPVATPIVDTASEHTVTVPSISGPRFFRLKK